MGFIKAQSQDANLCRACDQFLAMVILNIVPTTLMLVSFTFEENKVDQSTEEQAGFASVLPVDPGEFVQWLIHVLSATLCFIGMGDDCWSFELR